MPSPSPSILHWRNFSLRINALLFSNIAINALNKYCNFALIDSHYRRKNAIPYRIKKCRDCTILVAKIVVEKLTSCAFML